MAKQQNAGSGGSTRTNKPTTVVDKVSLSDAEGVAQYLTDPNVSVVDKLERLSKEAYSGVSVIVGTFLDHVSEFSSDKPELEPTYVIGKLFNLHNVIKNIVTTQDAKEYTVKMDIMHLVFKEFGSHGDAFYPSILLRYDHLWRWGVDSLKTHQVLSTIISTLADRSTRSEELKRLDINGPMAKDGLDISQDDLDRMSRYYNG